jgi:glycerol-3-phosphate dehydrogenase (NAD(P)+)
MKIAVLGSGAWGTALAIAFATRHEVTLWGRDAAQVDALRRDRCNHRYLPDIAIPESIALTSHLPQALASANLLLAAVPTNALRETLRALVPAQEGTPLVWACKGFEKASSRLPHQIVAEELGADLCCGALSGPSFAREVAEGKPAALTLASSDVVFARTVARELHSPRLRVYSSNDVIGVELGGALKNVIAIAAGVCDGLGLGYNARAALITRGLAEATRLGVRLGGEAETFMGLTGMGDLVLTCTGDLSRNRRVGLSLAQGLPLAQILGQLGHVAEGVPTAPEVARIAREAGVEMPITDAVCALLGGQISASEAVEALMRRDPKAEGPESSDDQAADGSTPSTAAKASPDIGLPKR